jgi:2-methylcitrate dehydratase PrpD
MLERYWILLVDKGGKMGEITERIAKFIFETDYEKVPQGAIKLAKESILDNLSCMILGSVQPVGKLITEFVGEMGGKPEASIVGANFKTNAPYAALANGVLAQSLDYDDSIMTAITHPSSSFIACPSHFSYRREGKNLREKVFRGLCNRV